MVIEKRSFLKSCFLSIYIGIRHFFGIFGLLLLPFSVYLPFIILKSFPTQLANKLFPEMNPLVLAGGIVLAVVMDCFMILCVSQRLIDTRKGPKV